MTNLRIMDRVLNVLVDHPNGLSSRRIGLALGREPYDATAYVATSLRKLIAIGAVQKNENGTYYGTGLPAPAKKVPSSREKQPTSWSGRCRALLEANPKGLSRPSIQEALGRKGSASLQWLKATGQIYFLDGLYFRGDKT